MEMHTGHIWYDKSNKPKLLIFGGRAYDFSDPLDPKEAFNNDIFMFDPETKNWSVFASMPVPICSHAACIVSNRYIVLYGGTNGMKIFDNVM